jgi:hypothetical protein
LLLLIVTTAKTSRVSAEGVSKQLKNDIIAIKVNKYGSLNSFAAIRRLTREALSRAASIAT